LFDKLNTPKMVVVVLVIFLIVNGFLFYHHQLVKANATSPQLAMNELDIVPPANSKSVSSSDREEPQAKKTGENADHPDGGKEGDLVAQESESGSSLASTPILPAQDQAASYSAPAAENQPVVVTDVPAPTDLKPVYEENPEATLTELVPTYQAFQY